LSEVTTVSGTAAGVIPSIADDTRRPSRLVPLKFNQDEHVTRKQQRGFDHLAAAEGALIAQARRVGFEPK